MNTNGDYLSTMISSSWLLAHPPPGAAAASQFRMDELSRVATPHTINFQLESKNPSISTCE